MSSKKNSPKVMRGFEKLNTWMLVEQGGRKTRWISGAKARRAGRVAITVFDLLFGFVADRKRVQAGGIAGVRLLAPGGVIAAEAIRKPRR